MEGRPGGSPAGGAMWLLWVGAMGGVGHWPGGPLFTLSALSVAWCLVAGNGGWGVLFPARWL